MPRLPGDTIREKLLLNHTVDEATGCWLWTGCLNPGGYGLIWKDGSKKVHRVAYEEFVGPIPAGLHLDHVYERGCRHRHCINVAHLEPVTIEENARRTPAHRRVGHATWTHCKRGHEFTPENTRVNRLGHRRCLTCERDSNRAVQDAPSLRSEGRPFACYCGKRFATQRGLDIHGWRGRCLEVMSR